MLNRFMKTDIGEIQIFSWDVKMHDDMSHNFLALMPEVANNNKLCIGDVRNKSSLKQVMRGGAFFKRHL